MKIVNKQAHFNYVVTESFEAGLQLTGAEVKAVRLGHADLSGSFVRINGSEAYLINCKIFPYQYARPDAYDEDRTRKLLLHKKEIISLKAKTDGLSLTIVPISLYNKGNLIKAEIALGKPKKKFDKRQTIKKRDIDREIAQTLKDRNAR